MWSFAFIDRFHKGLAHFVACGIAHGRGSLFCSGSIIETERSPISFWEVLWHAELFRDVEFHLCYGQLLRRNSRQFFSSDFARISQIHCVCLCSFVPWAMSRGVLLAVLLVYMDCWKSISVRNYCVFWTLMCLHARCQQMLIIYDRIRPCRCGARSKHISFVRHFVFPRSSPRFGSEWSKLCIICGFSIFEFRLDELF